MRNHVRHSRGERGTSAFEEGEAREPLPVPLLTGLAAPGGAAAGDGADDESGSGDDVLFALPDDDADEAFEDELADVVRLSCPDCGRPIAVVADRDTLPQHAVCPTPWDPFGLTVCPGSGRAVADARPLDAGQDEPQERVVLLTLPAGLDWRTQPFSHVGGPGSRPMRVPPQRLAA